MNDLTAIVIGFAIGLMIVFGLLWRERDAVRQGLRQRRAELFGENGPLEEAVPSPPIQSSGQGVEAKHRLAIGVGLLAAVGSAIVAAQTSDEVVRALNITLCAILVVGSGVLFLRVR